jgi:hypothetical protein
MSEETKDLVKWDEELAKYAEQGLVMEKGTKVGQFFSFQGGVMTYLGETCTDNSFKCVVLDAAIEQSYYEKGWDPDNTSGPDCFALGKDLVNLSPDITVAHPQHDTCGTCPKNAWGSGKKANGAPSKGKACKSRRRLMIIPFAMEAKHQDIIDAEVAFMGIPTMSVGNWADYIRKVSLVHRRPFWAVATKVFLKPDKKTQFQVKFEFITIMNVELLSALKQRMAEAQKLILTPYTVTNENESEDEPVKERLF